MNGIELFAFVIMPTIVMAFGAALAWSARFIP